MKKAIRRILCVLLFAAGAALFLYPAANAWLLEQESRAAIAEFEGTAGSTEESAEAEAGEADSTEAEAGEAESGDGTGSTGTGGTADALWESIRAYNQGLWENGQSEFRDAWSVTQTPSTVEGLEDEVFGYIEIPAMDVALPLYVGASTSNLAKGAAILGATSLPIGGGNTNSVIAAHRGYRGIPFFREIEKLGVGDAVYITNAWGTLGYRVESIDIIDPYDSDKVKIQAGKDMVTLMTCHTYRSHGKYRYVVYCVRDDSVLTEEARAAEASGGVSGDGYITASDGSVYETSQADIETEHRFRYACGAALIIFFLFCMLSGRKKRRREA